MTLVQQLVDGPWDDERFLVVPPGGRVAASFDEKIIKVEGLGQGSGIRSQRQAIDPRP